MATKADLEAENARLLAMVVKQTKWIRSISAHYDEMTNQLLTLAGSMTEGQKDFISFFKTIKGME